MQVRKLPKFAQFGTLAPAEAESSSQPADAKATPTSKAAILTPPSSNHGTPAADAPSAEQPPSASAYRPTRKVRELPGGGSKNIASLFGGDDDEVETPVSKVAAPTQDKVLREKTVPAPSTQQADSNDSLKGVPGPQTAVIMPDGSKFVPSRRVREPVGGFSSMSALLSGE